MKNTLLLLLLLVVTEISYADSIQKLQLYYGASFYKYNLDGDQFTAELPMASSQAYALDYAYQNIKSEVEHRLSLLKSGHDITVPSSLSPSKIKSTQTRANYKLVATNENTNMGLGYSFYKIQTDETSPNVLITNSESHAIDLFIEHSVWHKSDLSISVFADLELPFLKKEFATQSGLNQRSYILKIGYDAKYLLTESWSILQKSDYSFDTTSYDGQGNRGTLNANEKSQRFQFLLGAGYDF